MRDGPLCKKQVDPPDPADQTRGRGERWCVLTPDRPTGFISDWRFGTSEAVAAPAAVTLTRQRTVQQTGVLWLVLSS
jgi:hypothetical protein